MSLVVEVHLLEASPSPWASGLLFVTGHQSEIKDSLEDKIAIRCVFTLLVSDLHGLNQHPSCTAYPLLLTFEELTPGNLPS